VQEKFVATFGLSVSPARLQAYRLTTDRDDLDALGRYLWNTALSEALYPSVQNAEIALRNSLHRAIGHAIGNPSWLTAMPSVLTPAHQAKVSDARHYLNKRKKQLDEGRVVAELNFGFWVSLFNNRVRNDAVAAAGAHHRDLPRHPTRRARPAGAQDP